MDIQRLADMLNQIARNLAAQGTEVAISQTAQHVRDFWDPRMRVALTSADPALLDPIAAAAVARLRETC